MRRLRSRVVGWSVAGMISLSGVGAAGQAPVAMAEEHPQLFMRLPEASIQARGRTRTDLNYTFSRGNRATRVYDATQTTIGTRTNHRKTHLVTWRLQHGLTETLQPEAEVVYHAWRQHTHGDGDSHDRNDDGDFERLMAGMSWQALRERKATPNLRLRGGFLIPNRAEDEGIGQEAGFELLAAASKAFGAWTVLGAASLAVTFDNHDQPSDPVFGVGPRSPGQDLRTWVYGIGVQRPLGEAWYANLELEGRAFDTIRLNTRVHESELTVTPGLFYHRQSAQREVWVGLGISIGATHDTDHVGIGVRTGMAF